MRFSDKFLIFSGILTFLLAQSCANQIALTGGPRDEQPPRLDTSLSTKNYQTFFDQREFELYFDEYIDLRDAAQQLVISPPLDHPPSISNRLKRISFNFNEEEILKEDVTYVVNFGQSIRDFTESNILDNFTFVFSTGAVIDSLEISGKVVDAATNEAKKDALIMLYTDDSDSIVFSQRPFYFAKADDNGQFTIKNLRADTFKVVTIMDENLNYFYDPLNEEIGFLDSLIILTDSSDLRLTLEMFKENTEALYQSYDASYQGQLTINFEGTPDSSSIQVIDSISTFQLLDENNGRVLLWYHPYTSRSVRFTINRNNELDTISARINRRNVDTLVESIFIESVDFNGQVGLHPEEDLKLIFDRPVSKIDSTLIVGIDTSLKDTFLFPFGAIDLPNLELSLKQDWVSGTEFQLMLYPGAITDFFGKSNDTLIRSIRIAASEDFGTIDLEMSNLDTFTYQLLIKRGNTLIDRASLLRGESKTSFSRIPPDTYTVEIIEDRNGNGKWDPGNYLEGKQSERIYQVPLESLRADWVMDLKLDFETIKKTNASSSEEQVSSRRE